jgi:hypothetical protein
MLGQEPGPDDLVLLEIKQKRCGTVHKRRAQIRYGEARRLFLESSTGMPSAVEPSADPVVREFCHLCRFHRAAPVANIHYLREAYQSRMGDDVRITMDYALTTSPATGGAWFSDGGCQSVSAGGVILEIKFKTALPQWTAAFVRRFDLRNRSVPKYVMCIQHASGAELPHLAWLPIPPARKIG